MRAECQEIRIGRMTNVQDFVMVHVGYDAPTVVGDFCSITHHTTLHGCTVEDDCLDRNRCHDHGRRPDRSRLDRGRRCAFVPEGREIPPGSIVAGVPGKVIAERDSARANRLNAWQYHRNAEHTARGEHRAWTGPEYEAWLEARRAELDQGGDGLE